MIKIVRSSQKEHVETAFNFPDDDPQAELLKLIAKTGNFGFDLICEQFKIKKMNIIRFKEESKEDYEKIDYSW